MGLKISFLIPAYNEEEKIASLIQSLSANKPCLSAGRKDIIVVDDGSCDKTTERVETTGAILLKHSKNRGKGEAHKTGFKYIIAHNYDYVITLDGDGQHNPAESERFIKKLNTDKKDILVGTRSYSPKNMPMDRFLTNFTTSLVVSILAHNNIRDSQSGYRAISTEVLKKVKLTTSNYQTESEILIKAGRMGYKIGAVPISTIYGVGKSKIRPGKDTLRFIVLALRSLWR